MLKSAKSFLNIPIISLYNTTKIGSLLDFVVHPDIGKIIGVVGERSGFLKKNVKVVSIADIREMSKEALIVDNEDALVPQGEIIKIDNILKSGIKIFGNKVVTESGRFLGKVSDFLIDELFYLAKIYVKPPLINFFETEIIIPRDFILKVTKEEIIVSDNFLERVKDTEAIGVTE